MKFLKWEIEMEKVQGRPHEKIININMNIIFSYLSLLLLWLKTYKPAS